MPQLIAQALDLRPVADQPLLEALLSFVRVKQFLLILDNCEHLSEVCARLARQLLSQAPELCILATSREPLAIVVKISCGTAMSHAMTNAAANTSGLRFA